MKALVWSVFLATIVFGGYKAYKLVLVNLNISEDRPLPPSTQTKQTHENPSPSSSNPKADALAKLKLEIDKQIKVVSDLDAKLTEINQHLSPGDIASQLEDEVNYQQDYVDYLANQADNLRNSISAQGPEPRVQYDYPSPQTQFQISKVQDTLKGIRERLRDSRRLRLNVMEIKNLQDKLADLQTQFDTLKEQQLEQRGAILNARSRKAQIDRSRSALKQLEGMLATERKRLREIQTEFQNQQKTDNQGYKDRNQIQDQYQAAKIRLFRLQDDYAKKSR